ncbi:MULTISPECIES: hypothetical protein [Aeromonas]|uniref:hypothetical protein n=1 Tax=Aeromonas TaxID=642 RepID=UPI00057349A4|nr:hypothetical protein [Aeromonas hydrophila]KHN53678.1 hypothetical protein OI72_16690 [Aeromonas hydrophila]OFC44902.1 hypothetical protein BA189_17180 [Aeromonas hydrophila]OFC54747.1 hypothetical protein BA188_22560 [Aeromonas hydrophila]
MDMSALSTGICSTANTIISSYRSSMSDAELFCIKVALEPLIDLAADYGLVTVRQQLLGMVGRIEDRRQIRHIEETVTT